MTTEKQQDIVMIVDDSPDSVGMLNAALDDAGYTVLVALNGAQALTIAQQLEPSVILLDAMMPVMDGFECCPKLRAMLPLTPIIFMTGLTETEDIVRGFEAGGNDYITKPIRPEELIARIRVHTRHANFITHARDALDVARQFVFSVNNNGETLWSTPEARELLRQAEEVTDTFSSQISEWLETNALKEDLNLGKTDKSLAIRYFKKVDDNEHLLRFMNQDLNFKPEILEKELPITSREAEVLFWVAHGKSNKEIAEILGMSPRTVNKHLEQVYPKIEVDNRAAATSVAIKALLGFSN